MLLTRRTLHIHVSSTLFHTTSLARRRLVFDGTCTTYQCLAEVRVARRALCSELFALAFVSRPALIPQRCISQLLLTTF